MVGLVDVVVTTLGGGNGSASSMQVPLTHNKSEALITATLSLSMSDRMLKTPLPFVLFCEIGFSDTKLSTNFAISNVLIDSFCMLNSTLISLSTHNIKVNRTRIRISFTIPIIGMSLN